MANIVTSMIMSAFNAVKNAFHKEKQAHDALHKTDMTAKKKRNRKFPRLGLLVWDARRGSFRRGTIRPSLLRNHRCACGSGIKTKKCCAKVA